jgi:hypothetical protein
MQIRRRLGIVLQFFKELFFVGLVDFLRRAFFAHRKAEHRPESQFFQEALKALQIFSAGGQKV